MATTGNNKTLAQAFNDAPKNADGSATLVMEFSQAGKTLRAGSIGDILYEPMMAAIKDDDAQTMQGSIDLAMGMRADIFSIGLPLVNFETNEQTDVDALVMSYQMGRKACFDVCFDHLQKISLAPNDLHPALKSLVESFGHHSDDPNAPEPYATMSTRILEGFCEVALSHGALATVLEVPMPSYIHKMAKRVLLKHLQE